MNASIRLIAPLFALGVVAFCAASAVAQGSSPRHGACFELGDEDAKVCVPVEMSMIEIQVEDGRVWSDFQRGLLTVTIRILPDPRELPVEQGPGAVFEQSHIGEWLISPGTLIAQLGMRRLGDVTLVEARTAASDLGEHYLELSASSGTMVIIVSDFSPDRYGTILDFERAVNLIRLSTNAGGNRLPDLDDMEPWGVVR